MNIDLTDRSHIIIAKSPDRCIGAFLAPENECIGSTKTEWFDQGQPREEASPIPDQPFRTPEN
jgi:hypothetical protein